jgi:hypothetical protein
MLTWRSMLLILLFLIAAFAIWPERRLHGYAPGGGMGIVATWSTPGWSMAVTPRSNAEFRAQRSTDRPTPLAT